MTDRHVFENVRDDDGSHRYSAAYVNPDGLLVVKTHDLGPVVQKTFGMSEYEALETFNADQTAQLHESLGENLISAIAARFADSVAFAKYCECVGVGRGTLWNRVGD